MLKVVEYVLLLLGIIGLYAQGCFLTKEIELLRECREDLDMQLLVISNLTGEKRRAEFEIDP